MQKIRFKLKLVQEIDGIENDMAIDIATFDKDCRRPEHIGLNVTEAKNILRNLQTNVVETQINKAIQEHGHCNVCQAPLIRKDSRKIKYRTLYGTLDVENPRYYLCECQSERGLSKKSVTPLSNLLSGHTALELQYFEAKWSSLMSYGMTVDLLKDCFPVDDTLSISTTRRNTLKVAKKIDESLEEEKHIYATPFAKADPEAFENETTVLGLDGAYIRLWSDKKTNFELIVGKSIPVLPIEKKQKPSSDQTVSKKRTRKVQSKNIAGACLDKAGITKSVQSCKTAKVFGLVSSQDDKPKRRLYETLKSQGIKDSDGVCFLSDGGESLKKLQTNINPNAKHILEWFHITMKITVLQQYIKGVTQIDSEHGAEMKKLLESIKWKLWHGKPLDALTKILKLSDLIAAHAKDYSKFVNLIKHNSEFFNYISNNIDIIVDYGKRWRSGKRISTSFTESLVNYFISKRFCKKQQMQWSKQGAHLLVQVRAKVVNGELRQIFKGWYKDFDTGAADNIVFMNDVNTPTLAMAA